MEQECVQTSNDSCVARVAARETKQVTSHPVEQNHQTRDSYYVLCSYVSLPTVDKFKDVLDRGDRQSLCLLLENVKEGELHMKIPLTYSGAHKH